MLKIRLQRVGRKHEPVFRLVLTDSKNAPKSGRFNEILGHFDARKGEKAEFKTEEIKDWISKGAQVSDTVHNLLIDRKIIDGKKINVLPKKSPIISEEAKAAAEAAKAAPAKPEEAPVATEAPTEEKVSTENTGEVVEEKAS